MQLHLMAFVVDKRADGSNYRARGIENERMEGEEDTVCKVVSCEVTLETHTHMNQS